MAKKKFSLSVEGIVKGKVQVYAESKEEALKQFRDSTSRASVNWNFNSTEIEISDVSVESKEENTWELFSFSEKKEFLIKKLKEHEIAKITFEVDVDYGVNVCEFEIFDNENESLEDEIMFVVPKRESKCLEEVLSDLMDEFLREEYSQEYDEDEHLVTGSLSVIFNVTTGEISIKGDISRKEKEQATFIL